MKPARERIILSVESMFGWELLVRDVSLVERAEVVLVSVESMFGLYLQEVDLADAVNLQIDVNLQRDVNLLDDQVLVSVHVDVHVDVVDVDLQEVDGPKEFLLVNTMSRTDLP